jgi:hypothetical protein
MSRINSMESVMNGLTGIVKNSATATSTTSHEMPPEEKNNRVFMQEGGYNYEVSQEKNEELRSYLVRSERRTSYSRGRPKF